MGNDPEHFEFLIRGDIELSPQQFDALMLPRSVPVKRIRRDDWNYYQAEGIEFSYSWEMPGIQMSFTGKADFHKAHQMAQEVVKQLNEGGFAAELILIDHTKIIRFDS